MTYKESNGHVTESQDDGLWRLFIVSNANHELKIRGNVMCVRTIVEVYAEET